MKFNWFNTKKRNQNQPYFWQKYSEKFEKKTPENIDEIKFVVFDTEATGFDFEKDRILSIGAVRVQNREIKISENFEVYLEQERFNPETVKIHGIIQNEKFEKVEELEALKLFLAYIENSVLVAHHAGFDLKMVNKALKRHNLPKLKNKFLDTAYLYKKTRIATNFIDPNKMYSLDDIAEDYNIEAIDRHTATGDAFITALIFMKLLGKIKSKGKLPLRTY
ncbi:3'-5' exonuclease [Gramella sp. AN32]|uniref:PolC-type DNA polymerase III n=1 Tax=Christiangramia antarctica TaxID=2058158 RepID=A0ABW5X3Z7_9FLAO|nr:3'-5' exonuclease [Gramella sp. AN32]MCM4156874.1 3'-5' exonuclease [Gramella sp. AN32]